MGYLEKTDNCPEVLIGHNKAFSPKLGFEFKNLILERDRLDSVALTTGVTGV